MGEPHLPGLGFLPELRRLVHGHVLVLSGFAELVGFAVHAFADKEVRSFRVFRDDDAGQPAVHLPLGERTVGRVRLHVARVEMAAVVIKEHVRLVSQAFVAQ